MSNFLIGREYADEITRKMVLAALAALDEELDGITNKSRGPLGDQFAGELHKFIFDKLPKADEEAEEELSRQSWWVQQDQDEHWVETTCADMELL